MAAGEQREVVDAGGRRNRDGVGSGHGVGVAADDAGDTGAHRPALVADVDGGEVERVEDALDAAADEDGVDLEGVAVHADRRCLGHRPLLGPQERLVQLVRRRDHERPAGNEPLERGGVGLGVDPAVIRGLDPRAEQPVHLDQVSDTAGGGLDEELVAHGPKEPFDLAAAFGPSRSRVDEADAEHGARPQQRGRHERAAVVDVDRARDPAGAEAVTQRRLQADGVLGVAPPVAGDGAGVVIDEREQVGLLSPDPRAVQRVTSPTVIRRGRLEPAERLRRAAVGPGVQPQPGEQALDGPLRRRPPLSGGDHRGHLRRGASRRLVPELHCQVQHRRRRLWLRASSCRHERVEAAGPPAPDPAVEGVAADAHAFTVRPGVVAGGKRAHQRAALGLGQRQVGRFADQRVAEQRHVTVAVIHGASWHLEQRGSGG